MIRVKNIKKGFSSGLVIKDLSLTVHAGKVVILTGVSGCGKTTLLRLIAGIERPDSGEIFLGGQRVSNETEMIPPYQRSVGFVFQSPSLFPHMTVEENIRFSMPEMSSDIGRSRLEILLRDADIDHIRAKNPYEISGGEAQRVSILRALAAESHYLLLDEPFTDLDPDLKSRMIALVKEHIRKKQITTILVTHDEGDIHAMNAPVLNMHPELEAVIS